MDEVSVHQPEPYQIVVVASSRKVDHFAEVGKMVRSVV